MEIEGFVETTLGDLIEALTDESILLVRDEKDANILVGYMLRNLFCTSRPISKSWH